MEKSLSVSSFVRAAVFQRGKRSRFIFVVKLYFFFLCKLGKGNFEAGAWKNGVVFMFYFFADKNIWGSKSRKNAKKDGEKEKRC